MPAYANAVDIYEPAVQNSYVVQYGLQKALGERVRQLRLKQDYSQEAFADHCGVHRTFMGTIERGETNISFDNLAKIASGLGVTLSTLLSGIERQAAKIPSPDVAAEKARRVRRGRVQDRRS